MRRLLTGIVVTFAAGCAGISTQQEVEMGQQYAQQINSQLPLVQDAEVNRYVNVLGDSLARVADTRGLEWRFYVVNSSEVNAFAVPGGFIYVNRGLIEQAQNMSELAGVIGHEIGHVTHRHSIQQMEKQQGAQLGLSIGCVLAPNLCNNQLGATAINLGANAVFAGFSRHDEAEADQAGVEYTTRAGIDPRGIPDMFRILLSERQRNPSKLEAWFATHPLEESRIHDTEATIAKISPAVLQSLTKDSRAFHTMQSRLKSLPPAPQQASR